MLDKNLIAKFRANECSEDELQFIYSWLSNPAYTDEVSALLKYDWDNVSSVHSQEKVEYDELYSDILREINIKKKTAIKPVRSKVVFWRYAAAAMLVLAVSFYFVIRENVIKETPEVVYITRSNPAGQKLSLSLKDGSRVTLNSRSTIRFTQDFDADGRRFYLEGEAFFEVAKDSLRPFQVITDNITVTALGTSFNVKEDSNMVKVALVTGVVDVTENVQHNSTILMPGEGIFYTEKQGLQEKYLFDPKEATGWKDGILYFNNNNLPEIFNKLESWYGVDFKVEGMENLRNRKYSGEFKDESLDHVLQAISFTEGITYSIEGKSVSIQP